MTDATVADAPAPAIVLQRLASRRALGLSAVWLVALGNAAAIVRVAAVVEEGPGVVSLRIEGRRLARLRARPGQFFTQRFPTRGRWWTARPFSPTSGFPAAAPVRVPPTQQAAARRATGTRR
jgi:hypothetical protein